MDRRRLLGILGLGTGVAAITYAVFAPQNDEELILAVLDELALSVSFSEPIANPVIWGLQLNKKLEDLMTEQVELRVSEVRQRIPSSRAQLGPTAGIVLQRYGAFDVTFSQMDVQVTGDQATARGTADVTLVAGGEPRSDDRPVTIAFVRIDGDWRVQSLQAKAPRED